MRGLPVPIALAIITLVWFGQPALAARLEAGLSVDLTGTEPGDVVITANQVSLDATIDGGLIVTGREVSGSVDANRPVVIVADAIMLEDVSAPLLVVSGSSVRLSGIVTAPVIVLGGRMTQDIDSILLSSLAVNSISAGLFGSINGDVQSSTGQLHLTGSIGGDFSASAGTALIGPAASVGGDLTLATATRISLPETMQISGQTVLKTLSPVPAAVAEDPFRSILLSASLMVWLTGMALILFAPRFAEALGNRARKRWWSSAGWGLLSLCVAMGGGLVLIVTMIGIPFGIALFGLMPMVMVLGLTGGIIGISFALRSRLKNLPGFGDVPPRARNAVGWTVTLAIMIAIALVPILGWAILWVLMLIGTGALVTNWFGGPEARYADEDLTR